MSDGAKPVNLQPVTPRNLAGAALLPIRQPLCHPEDLYQRGADWLMSINDIHVKPIVMSSEAKRSRDISDVHDQAEIPRLRSG